MRRKRTDDAPELRRTGQLLTGEACLATPLKIVTTGTAVTGLALALGANAFQIAALASLPQVAALMQLAATALGARFPTRKRGSITLLTWGRAIALLLVPVPFLALAFPAFSGSLVWAEIIGVTLTIGGTALGTVLWLGWVTDLVPATERGSFFAGRAVMAGIFSMALGPAIGWFLDAGRKAPGTNPDLWRFSALFGGAALLGVLTAPVLRRVPEAHSPPPPAGNLFTAVRETLANPPMRTYIVYKSAFNFAVGFAAPFFTVYTIRNLGLPYTLIYAASTLNALVTLVSYRVWGRVLDRPGARRVLTIATISKGLMALVYVVLTPLTVWPLLLVVNLFGYADAGLELSNTNILMAVAPRARNTEQFAVALGISGAVQAISPLIAAPMVIWLAGVDLPLGGLHIGNLQLLFLLSGVLRIGSLLFFRTYRDPERERAPDAPENRLNREGAKGAKEMQGV